MTEVAGVTWGTKDPTVAPDPSTLKETDFVWAKPLDEKSRTGLLKQEKIPEFTKVGTYVWPGKNKTLKARIKAKLHHAPAGSPPSPSSSIDDKVYMVGVFMHGGGYCHMSAHEESRTSRMPRGFIQVRRLSLFI